MNIKKILYYFMVIVLTLFILCYFPALSIMGNYYDEHPTEKMQITLDFIGRDEALSILFTVWKIIIVTSIVLALIEMFISKKDEEAFLKSIK